MATTTEKKSQSYEMDLCSGPILPQMLRFSLPIMASGVLQLLFNAADIAVIGHFAGDNSLAAVGSNGALINLLVNLFIGLSVGSNILASRLYGANDHAGLQETVHTSVLLSLVSGVILAGVGSLCAKPILVLMSSPPAVLDLAALYLRIYFLGMPAMMLYNFGAALLRALGDTRRPLYYLTVAGIINVVLNLLFVAVFHMDVAGVALATAVSQCVSALLVLRCMIQDDGVLHLDLHKLRISPIRLRQILRTGLPAGFQGILVSLSNVVIQSSINLFGEVAVAGNAAASNIDGFVYLSMNAFHQASISFTSQNLGAGKTDRVRKILFCALGCSAVIGTSVACLSVVLGPQLLSIYTQNPDVIAAGMIRLLIVGLLYPLCGLLEVVVGSLRGMGYAVLPMLVSLIGFCVLRIVILMTVFHIPAYHNIYTVYWTYPISWVITLIAQLGCFFWAYRHLKRR